ncbi:MAG TPA: L-seryl-tRNA(Sec) selenium transferase [Pyrinomonadaceae bacterium]|jgi:L-seryl-tRNA(Ser) seleniumtransferase|nr:L-seryl-tRNA(Sec) selenium transferase [Pyrinomonadaceae bacterium]
MADPETSTKKTDLSLLPSVDALLRSETGQDLVSGIGVKHLTLLARAAIEGLRAEIARDNGKSAVSREELLKEAQIRLAAGWDLQKRARLQKVINATGVIIHTNLGRAPLSEAARAAVAETGGYCTLEYDLATGKRGRRGARAEKLLADLTGAEAALIVNNCAAAAYLVLTALAAGGETIISRGELVEIGGDFRIPDVMKQAGTTLVEVGTTNRTKLSDYKNAITENTRLIARVHPSNFRVIGFTSSPSVAELAELAHKRGLTFFEDAGSGALPDLTQYGLDGEPRISDSVAAGVDVATFSGDKLLGGLQTGLIVGRAEVVEKLRKHPLYRVLRVDKLTYATLEATLESYLRGTELEDIPVLKMLSQTKEQLAERAANFVENLSAELSENSSLVVDIIPGHSAVGGGAAPEAKLETSLIALTHKTLSANQLEEKLRLGEPPVITRVLEDKVVLDLRTVSESDENVLVKTLQDLS